MNEILKKYLSLRSYGWGLLLLEILKENKEKGLTLDEIISLFPSKSKGAIQSILYRYNIPRKEFKDSKTGKCRKIYYYPQEVGKNWKKKVKNLLYSTKYGLSLTEILLETGIPKKKLKQYLDSLGSDVNKIETFKKSQPAAKIIRFYLGDRQVEIKKEEESLQQRIQRIQRTKKVLLCNERNKKIKEIAISLLNKNKRLTVKELMIEILKKGLSLPRNWNGSAFLKKEGFKCHMVAPIYSPDSNNRPYLVYYIGEECSLRKFEEFQDFISLRIEKAVISSLQGKSSLIRKEIKSYVLSRTKFKIAEHAFNSIMHQMVVDGKIKMYKKDGKAFYTLQ